VTCSNASGVEPTDLLAAGAETVLDSRADVGATRIWCSSTGGSVAETTAGDGPSFVKMNSVAESERLTLRRPTEADIPALALLWADERVTRFMGGARDFERVSASMLDDLKSPPPKFDLWPVLERGSEIVVGHCGLLRKKVNDRDEVELIYVIAAEHWGRGYATEAAGAIRDYAFRELAITRLVSLINPANSASERVAAKLGMKFESETFRPGGKTLKLFSISK